MCRRGVVGLLHRDYKSRVEPTLQGEDQVAFVAQLLLRLFRRAKDAQAWIKERTRTELALAVSIRCWEKPAGS